MTRLQRLQQFLAEDPNDPFTMYALAAEYKRLGDMESSRSWFERLVAQHPNYVGTYYHLAGLYLEAGLRDEALATYRSGIRVALAQRDHHARAELQAALMEADGQSTD